MSSRPRTPEDYLPPTAALFAYMLIPSAILFVAGLTTTVLLSNFHHSYDCHERVNAYLWGGVILFYLWTLFHFTVLFGPPSWLRPLSLKLALTGIIAVAFGCWIAMGHVTIDRYMHGDCVREQLRAAEKRRGHTGFLFLPLIDN